MSIQVVESAEAALAGPFDAIIDVRSPAEFAEDHVPGAENLPVLDDAERAQVGTIYVQESRFRARRLGAALVARNIARHLETALADRPSSLRPLVYCWRGGQRSTAMATILSQVGWPTSVLAGGYRTYRRHVQHRLYDDGPSLDIVVLDGPTGSGKTDLIARLAGQGVQALDLEGLAEHRGSLFGGLGRPQPSQKMFESRLLRALEALDPARPVVVEAESSKIGDLMIPPRLWKAMTTAPRITVVAPPEARARYLVGAYAEITADRAALDAAMTRLPMHPSAKRLETWRAWADAGDFLRLAGELIELHYDPAYARSSKKGGASRLGQIALPMVNEENLARGAGEIAGLVERGVRRPEG